MGKDRESQVLHLHLSVPLSASLTSEIRCALACLPFAIVNRTITASSKGELNESESKKRLVLLAGSK